MKISVALLAVSASLVTAWPTQFTFSKDSSEKLPATFDSLVKAASEALPSWRDRLFPGHPHPPHPPIEIDLTEYTVSWLLFMLGRAILG